MLTTHHMFGHRTDCCFLKEACMCFAFGRKVDGCWKPYVFHLNILPYVVTLLLVAREAATWAAFDGVPRGCFRTACAQHQLLRCLSPEHP